MLVPRRPPKIADAFAAQQRLLRAEPVLTVFDVGANVGQTAVQYRATFPDAVIYSFEPSPQSFAQLRSRFAADKLVRPYQLALSARVGTSAFHVNQRAGTSSLLPVHEEGALWSPPGVMETVQTIEVRTATLDAFCQEHAITDIQILKMDVQGGEMMLLEGAADTLRRGSVALIYTEANFVSLYKSQAYFHELSTYLAQYRYRLFDFFNMRYAATGQLKWADAIFVNAEISQPTQ